MARLLSQKPGAFIGRALLCFSVLFSISAHAQRPIGTDVSGFQPSVNWTTVKNGGVVFAWSKATEGTYYVNPDFTSQESGATSVGIYMGAYHYARPGADTNITGAFSADSEAAYFWSVASNYVKYGGAYLVPMLDWEDVTATNGYIFTASMMSAWVNEWCNSVSNRAAASGVILRPVVYTGTWYSIPGSTYPGLTTSVTNWPDWIASYNGGTWQNGSPGSTFPWPSWNIWQYWDTNWSGGDSDVGSSNLSTFVQTFVIGGTNAPVFKANPSSIVVTPGSAATFSTSVSGQAPIGFQWRFNGSIIPRATSSNYTISSAQAASAGSYTVYASNAYANVPGSTAYLTVLTNAAAAALSPSNMVNWWPAESTPADIYGTNDASPDNVTYTTGEIGSAFHFTGSSSFLSDTASELTGKWTVCLWVNRQNAPSTSAAIMGDGTYALKLEQYNTTRDVGITKSGVADYLFSPAYSVPLSTWTHLAITYNGSAVNLYTNGALASSQLSSNGVIVSPPANLPLPRAYIGADNLINPATDYMLGNLDEIQVFSRVLSASEINSIYAAGNAGLVRVPEFSGVASTGNGQVQLNMRGQTGKPFTLLTSPDLLDWVSLGALSNPTGAAQYLDSTINSQQFYRVTQPQP